MGPEVLVGICMERSIEMVIGLLGILKANGAYVPHDPAYPRKRLAFMLEDASPAVLLTQKHLIERLAPHEQIIVQESEENLFNTIRSSNLAYMLYTSGSTGKSKDVLGTHRAAINRFHRSTRRIVRRWRRACTRPIVYTQPAWKSQEVSVTSSID